MRTTVALDATIRDRLLELKRRWGLPSVNDVILCLIENPVQGARALYGAHKRAVDSALERYGITQLVAFGSRARGDAGPESDLDLAARLPSEMDLVDMVHVQDDLGAAFGLPVHLVDLDGLRGRLAAQVKREGVVLVA